MSKIMYLKARTNNVGSECSTSLDITESEWKELSEKEQDELVNEYLGNIFECWVEPTSE